MFLIRDCVFYILLATLVFKMGACTAHADPLQVHSKLLKVAVVDTGLNSLTGAPLCDSGHADFSGTGTTSDSNEYSHGSNVTSLIVQEAGTTGYCIIVVKIFDAHGVVATTSALQYLVALHPDIVNLSWGGLREIKSETAAIKALLDGGTQIVAAAGNNGINLNKRGCTFYPSCADDRIIMVGNSNESSNYGHRVDVVLDGNDKVGGGSALTGSSQSCAIYTGRLIKALLTAPHVSHSKVTK